MDWRCEGEVRKMKIETINVQSINDIKKRDRIIIDTGNDNEPIIICGVTEVKIKDSEVGIGYKI